MPRLKAAGPNEVWSWDITYLPTTVRGVWLYLYLVIDVWSRKVVAWDVAEREEPAIAADLVGRACLRERISKGRKQPLVLHADNGNAMRAATLETRLEELGVLRSFSRPRVSNDNPYSESLFRTALSSTSRHASETHAGGHDPHAAGVSQKWFGSIHRQRKTNSNQLR
ncbi:DDE-type integrase/transposase/recombinase [Vulcanococcus sp. Clear-D1]|uniref:DDE-type integrase/transposase/recombinase n=1 Tax=Vulcanococcus sp. Clear-D1 TaxID=2766970 RepID=UPI0025CC467B|nr:DDE-type integrase/transposase/recombinase [Vulcanococcus sp. Clear-D1]